TTAREPATDARLPRVIGALDRPTAEAASLGQGPTAFRLSPSQERFGVSVFGRAARPPSVAQRTDRMDRALERPLAASWSRWRRNQAMLEVIWTAINGRDVEIAGQLEHLVEV